MGFLFAHWTSLFYVVDFIYAHIRETVRLTGDGIEENKLAKWENGLISVLQIFSNWKPNSNMGKSKVLQSIIVVMILLGLVGQYKFTDTS